MDGIIVWLCIGGIALVGLMVFRPGAPDPTDPQQAPDAIREGYGGILGVALLAVIALVAVAML
jgi:hypothetical protein